MAGKSRYVIAKKIIDELKSRGLKKVHISELRKMIIIFAGSDERRTIQPYLSIMVETDLIKDIGNFEFEL